MSISRKPALGFIFVTLLLDVIGFGIIIPVIPRFISELMGSNLSNASLISGWLMFSFSIMQFIFSPILGSLSDKYGRRPILLISLFGFCLNYLMIGFAPSIAWLFVGRILAGIMGASFTTGTAYIADISTPEKRAQNFGIVGAAFGIGFIIGPVLGGTLGHFGPRVPFFAAAGLTFLNWLYGYFVLPESLPKEHRRSFDLKRANPVGSLMQLKKYPLISGLVASLICVYIAGFATQSTWTFFTMEVFHWNEAMVGLSLGAVGLMVAIVQGGLIRIINPKLGSKNSIYVGLLLYTIGFILIAFATKGWMLFAFLVPYCLGGIAGPAVQGIMSNQVPANEQGELQGALTSLMSVTSIIGPILMTGIFSYFTGKHAFVYLPGAPFLLGALLTIVSIILAQKTLASLSQSHSTKPRFDAKKPVIIEQVEEIDVIS
jgi:MFS transporter, DHA1 family, tetracycline resistance protein